MLQYETTKLYTVAGMKTLREHPKLKTGLLLVLVALAVSIPLFCDGLFIPNPGHDLEFHLQRIVGLASAIQAGEIPCQIQPWWVRGMGYAVSAFYPDLFLYPSALLYLAGMSLENAYKVLLLGINFASVFLCYWSFKKIFKKDSIAWVGTLVYIFFPYRLTDLYLRSALGENLSLVFLPLCAESIHSIYTSQGSDKGAWKRMALAYAGICASHPLSLFIIGLFTALYCILRIRQTVRKSILLSLLKGTGMAVLLSLWFLVPLLQFGSSNTLYMNQMYRDVYPESIYVWQLLVPFSPSYGGSIHLGYGTKGEMPFYLGWASLAGFAVLIYKKVKRTIEKNWEVTVLIIMTVAAMWMCTRLFPYNQLNDNKITAYLVNKVQYPWRFEMVLVLLLSLIAMIAASHISAARARKYTRCIMAAAVLQGAVYLGSFMYHAELKQINSGDDLWSGNYMGGEFLPAAHFDDSLQDKSLEPYAYDADIISCEKDGLSVTVTIENNTDTVQKLVLPLTYYSEYQSYDADTGESFEFYNSGDGRLTVIVPAGYQGTIITKYTVKPLYQYLAVFSACMLVLLIIMMKRDQKKSITE
jgi:hypothetical protein